MTLVSLSLVLLKLTNKRIASAHNNAKNMPKILKILPTLDGQ